MFYNGKANILSKEIPMFHSTITRKGQTTIPAQVRDALNLHPGDKVSYELAKDHATLRFHRGARGLKGALKSDRGRGLSFHQIREAANATRVRKIAGKGAAA
jgi:antitoxin PrlF